MVAVHEFDIWIRPGGADSNSEIVNLFRKSMPCFEGYKEELQGELENHCSHRLDTHYFVAVDSKTGVVIGLIGYVLETQDVYQVGWFAVDEKHKGKGIGTALMKHIEAELASKARLLVSQVWDSKENKAALGFHRKMGFAPMATIPDFYDDEDGDMTMFVKRLKPKI